MIRIFEDGALLPTPFLNIGSLTSDGSEQGLLSMAFDPDYASSGLFYVYYTDDIASPGDITLARYSVSGDPDVADADSAEIMLVVPHPGESNHNGGQLAFSPNDGYLYMGTGDGGGGGDVPNNAQNRNILLGKMLRIDVDGTGTVPCGQSAPRPYGIPPSNPFVGETGCDEIWSYGLRNPWRFSFDRETGDMLIGDVGPERSGRRSTSSRATARAARTGAGGGWRASTATTRPTNCDDGQLELPILEYGHGLGCSVTGGFRYRGSAIPGIVRRLSLWGLLHGADLARPTRAAGGSWTSSRAARLGLQHLGLGGGPGRRGLPRRPRRSNPQADPGPEPGSGRRRASARRRSSPGIPAFTLTVNGSGFVYRLGRPVERCGPADDLRLLQSAHGADSGERPA